ncbi:MAG: Gfo/Idh/MocA family oxidoreductase [Verrucomicrobiales bacterium]
MIRIGVVGCGRILAAHLKGYRLLREAGFDDFRIAALCARREEDALSYVSPNEKAPQRPAVSTLPGDPLAIGGEYLSDFQDTGDVEIFTDYREMIASGRIDAVNDFTSHGMHHLVAAEAFAGGKHLLSQKPLGVTVRAARRMVEQAADAGVTFGVFENAAYRPAIRHAAWAFSAGGPAGDPQMAVLGNIGTWWAPDLVVAQTPWRHRKILGGGLAIDLGVHQFHMIRQIFGEIADVQGRALVVEKERHLLDEHGRRGETIPCDADDTFYASFSCVNGASGNLFASFAGRGTPTVPANGPTFYGSRGRVSGNEIHLDGETDARSLADLYEQAATAEQMESDFPRGLEDHFALTQHHWLEAIRTGTQPALDGASGLADLAAAYAILESDTARRRVSIDEVLTGELEAYQAPINHHFKIP